MGWGRYDKNASNLTFVNDENSLLASYILSLPLISLLPSLPAPSLPPSLHSHIHSPFPLSLPPSRPPLRGGGVGHPHVPARV
jgi:hypothetical protein